MLPSKAKFSSRLLRWSLVGATAVLAVSAWADSRDDEIKALREQIQLLDQRLQALEHKQEADRQQNASAAAATAAATQAAPKISASDRGFSIASADNANSLRFHGFIQLDSRLFFDDHGIANNGFVLRRARPILEGTLAKDYAFQFVPEFAGSSVSILDANLAIEVAPSVELRVGKFKAPLGLELLQSDANVFFIERSLATNLVPNRDLGVQVSGDVLHGALNYTAGIFNGQPDGGSTTNADIDNDKDFIARLYATPFRNSTDSLFQGLSLGVAASLGREKTTSGRTAAYRTDGQQTFFSYLPNTISDGQSWRVAPQLDYRHGSLGVTGEYVLSAVNVRPSATAPKAELQNKAWQLAAGYVLTGEDSSFSGVIPRENFNWQDHTWGAVEIVARYSGMKIDDKAFPFFASSAASADGASAFGFGANWYLSKAVRIMFDYFQTRFDFNATAPALLSTAVLRQDEKAFFTRFQLAF